MYLRWYKINSPSLIHVFHKLFHIKFKSMHSEREEFKSSLKQHHSCEAYGQNKGLMGLCVYFIALIFIILKHGHCVITERCPESQNTNR